MTITSIKIVFILYFVYSLFTLEERDQDEVVWNIIFGSVFLSLLFVK